MIKSLLFLFLSTISGEIQGGIEHFGYSVSIGKKVETYVFNANGVYQGKNYVWNHIQSDLHGYVYMNHNDKYEIKLTSHLPMETDAKVEINGKYVGLFRIGGNSSIILERSVNNPYRFVFVSKNSVDYYTSNLRSVNKEDYGVIKVTFYPEKEKIKKVESPKFRDKSKITYPARTTFLKETSEQTFKFMPKIEYDVNNKVTICLRLVDKEILKKVPSPKR